MLTVDMNSDLGESFGIYSLGNDTEVMKYISSANIACGYHAGDHNVMARTVEQAHKQGVAIGAHPGYPDLAGFGRRDMRISADEVYNMVVYQIGALSAVATSHGARLSHVKPHGALYNKAATDKATAQAIAQAVKAVDSRLVLFGLAGSELYAAGRWAGLKVAEEVYADRSYEPDGTLTPRSHPQALITDPETAITRVIRMVREQAVEAIDGSVIPVRPDTICVHGDGHHALLFAQRLYDGLLQEGISIRNFGV